MIVPVVDTKTATTLYVNSEYVVTVRADPQDPDHISDLKLRDGQEIRAEGAPEEIADKLRRA